MTICLGEVARRRGEFPDKNGLSGRKAMIWCWRNKKMSVDDILPDSDPKIVTCLICVEIQSSTQSKGHRLLCSLSYHPVQ